MSTNNNSFVNRFNGPSVRTSLKGSSLPPSLLEGGGVECQHRSLTRTALLQITIFVVIFLCSGLILVMAVGLRSTMRGEGGQDHRRRRSHPLFSLGLRPARRRESGRVISWSCRPSLLPDGWLNLCSIHGHPPSLSIRVHPPGHVSPRCPFPYLPGQWALIWRRRTKAGAAGGRPRPLPCAPNGPTTDQGLSSCFLPASIIRCYCIHSQPSSSASAALAAEDARFRQMWTRYGLIVDPAGAQAAAATAAKKGGKLGPRPEFWEVEMKVPSREEEKGWVRSEKEPLLGGVVVSGPAKEDLGVGNTEADRSALAAPGLHSSP